MILSPRKLLLQCLLFCSAALLSACLGPTYKKEIEPPVQLSAEMTADAEAEAPLGKWWSNFGDSQLDASVEAVFNGNLQYRAAWKRIEQAEYIRDQAAAGWWPQVDGSVSAGRAKRLGGGPLGSFEESNFSAELAAGYEIDVWGRVRASVYAAEQDIKATRADMESLAMTLSAQVVQAWLDILRERERRTLIEEQVELTRVFYELLVLRLKVGQATALDVFEQRQQLDALGSQLVLVEAREQAARTRLAVLLGRSPDAAVGPEGEELPELPNAMSTGVPADLLQRRPDVQAAYRRAESANARVVVAIADRLPAIRLSASLSLNAVALGDLFNDLFWSLAASIAGPIFDGGRRAAEVERTKAVLDERILLYGATLLQAAQEVQEALILERQQRLYIEELEGQVETANQILETARAQFQRGVTDYFRVLGALSTVLSLRSQLIDARYQLLLYRVQFHRAVGGSWTRDLEDPNPTGDEESDEQQ